MTIFSSSNSNSANMFPKTSKHIKVVGNTFSVVDGSAVLAHIALNNIKQNYDNYQRIRFKIEAGSEKFVLSYPLIGIKPVFLVILPQYCGCNQAKQYLYWKYLHSSEAYTTMTSIITLTGTSSNPIPQISIKNPDRNNAVYLDVLVASVDSDYLDDMTNYIYISNLNYNSIYTYDNGILGINNENNDLALTTNISNIVNISKVSNLNRIIIDDTTLEDIVLDFLTEEDTYQVLSELNYLLNNPFSVLPLPKDVDAPVITLKSTVINNEITVTLNNEYTKHDFITETVDSCFDDRDGYLIINPTNITFYNVNNQKIPSITTSGIYRGVIEINDIANNKSEVEINIYVQL